MAGMGGLDRLGMLSGQTNSMPQRTDDLLVKIADLLQQYLSLGSGTPVAHQAQSMMSAIQNELQGGVTGGAVTAAPAGSSPAEEAAESPADEKAEIAGGEMDADDPGYKGGGFPGALKGAKSALKKKNAKAKASK